MQAGRDVGNDEAGVFDFAAQLPHVAVRRAHLEPRHVAQPELDAVVPCPFDELQASLEAPLLRNHVVADRFLHGAPPRRRSYFEMSAITILTGCPGTGRTTVAGHLAKAK